MSALDSFIDDNAYHVEDFDSGAAARAELSAMRSEIATLKAKLKSMREQAFLEVNGETIAEYNARLREEQRDLRDAYSQGQSDERETWRSGGGY